MVKAYIKGSLHSCFIENKEFKRGVTTNLNFLLKLNNKANNKNIFYKVENNIYAFYIQEEIRDYGVNIIIKKLNNKKLNKKTLFKIVDMYVF